MTPRLANLLIAGVTKAGTTSLFSYLVQHDDVCGSSVKETEYFSPLLYPDGELAPAQGYAAFFRRCGDARYTLEATPNYWYGGPRLLDATEEMLGQPRYILSLRDPVERFWSELTYMHSKALLPRGLSAGDYLARCEQLRREGAEFTRDNRPYRTLSTGFYVDHVPELIERFGNRLHFVFFEHLAAEPQVTVGGVLDWLGLSRDGLAGFDFAAQNTTVRVRSASLARAARRVASVTRRYPRLTRRFARTYDLVNRGEPVDNVLDPAVRARLEEIYAPANEALRVVLSRAGVVSLPSWLGSP